MKDSGVVWRHQCVRVPFFLCLTLWETEIPNLYFKDKKASRATPHIAGWVPPLWPLPMAGSLFLFPQIIPGLHTPGSRVPPGQKTKEQQVLGTIGEPVQLWLSVSQPCQAVWSSWGNTQSLPGLERNSRKQKVNTLKFPRNWELDPLLSCRIWIRRTSVPQHPDSFLP